MQERIAAPDMVFIVSWKVRDSLTGVSRNFRNVFGDRNACDNFVAHLTYAVPGSLSVVGSTLYMRWPAPGEDGSVPLSTLTASGLAVAESA